MRNLCTFLKKYLMIKESDLGLIWIDTFLVVWIIIWKKFWFISRMFKKQFWFVYVLSSKKYIKACHLTIYYKIDDDVIAHLVCSCKVKEWWTDMTLLCRHNEHDSVSNHQPHHCLLNRLFGHRSKKTSKPRVTGLCGGNSPGTGEFPAQKASNAENVTIWWRHHEMLSTLINATQIYS